MIGITLGLAVMILTVAIVVGFQTEIRNKLIGVGAHIVISNYDNNQSSEPRPVSALQPFLTELRADPQVSNIQVFATKNGIVKTRTDNEGVLLKGVGRDFDWSYLNQNLKEGKTFTVSDTGVSRDILISKFLAARLGLKTGDKMVIYFLTQKENANATQYEQRSKVFYISGVYETGYEEIDSRLVFVDIAQIRKLNYWKENEVGGFEVTLKDFKKIDAKAEEVNELIGMDLQAKSIRDMNATIFSWLDLQDINATIVIVLMLLVASINMISALLILILERTNMIGILKALGSSNASIRKIFLYNSFYLIGKGLLWGNVLGVGLALFQQYTGFFELDQTQYYVSVIPVKLSLLNVVLLNLGTIVVCVLMLLLPSLIVARITPVKAIRFS
jgi:lipoprotein-releasing system permease protein